MYFEALFSVYTFKIIMSSRWIELCYVVSLLCQTVFSHLKTTLSDNNIATPVLYFIDIFMVDLHAFILNLPM